MPDDHDSIINTEWPRRAGVLRLAYHAVDDAGVTREAWGLEVEGDLPLDPRALRRAVERLPWPDGFNNETNRYPLLGLPHHASLLQIIGGYETTKYVALHHNNEYDGVRLIGRYTV